MTIGELEQSWKDHPKDTKLKCFGPDFGGYDAIILPVKGPELIPDKDYKGQFWGEPWEGPFLMIQPGDDEPEKED